MKPTSIIKSQIENLLIERPYYFIMDAQHLEVSCTIDDFTFHDPYLEQDRSSSIIRNCIIDDKIIKDNFCIPLFWHNEHYCVVAPFLYHYVSSPTIKIKLLFLYKTKSEMIREKLKI